MPRGYCLYPQNTDINEFLDDGKTPNPARCPYRTRWKPYVGKPPTNNRCCQRAYVRIKARADPNNKWIPATHVDFSDERAPRRPLALQNPKSCINQNESACYRNRRCNYDENHNVCEPMKWKPNQNCPGGSLCTNGNCVPKIGPSGSRERGCSDKYRCVLKDGAPWHRSCKGVVPGSPQHDEEESKVKEVWKPPIKKVTHRRKGCNEFQELNEGEPEPRRWCPVPRCYRHIEAGKRVCRSADDIGEEGDGDEELSDEEDIEVSGDESDSASDWSVDLLGDESDSASDWSVDLLGDESEPEYVMAAQEPQVSDEDSSDDEKRRLATGRRRNIRSQRNRNM